MNKKVFLGMIATTGLLFATSCSSEDLIETTSGDNVNVSFTVNTDSSVGSRAVADGMTAKTLYVAAYDQTQEGIAPKTVTTTLENGRTTVNLVLAKGHSYKLAFWAQADNAPYTFDPETGKVTISYEGNNNDETRDAFYANREYTDVKAINETVNLKRPFAQINVGTSVADYSAAKENGYTPMTSTVTLTGALATGFNVVEGVTYGTPVESVTFSPANIPNADTETLSVAGKAYEYISTCYVLPASTAESQTVKAEFSFTLATGENIELSQGLDMLPIQSNYRTNIVGDLLTANAEWNVVIDKDFDGEYNNIAESNEPAVSEDGTTYYVSTPTQWNWMVAKGGLKKNVTLMADLDFNGAEVATLYPDVAGFVFDGNGKTIKNAKYAFNSNMSRYKKGLFSLETYKGGTATFKNLTIDRVTVDNDNYEVYNGQVFGYAAALIGDVQENTVVTIDGVTVQNSTVKGTQSVGALVGLVAQGTTVNVKNTTVKGNKLTNYPVANESGYVCGLVGKVVGTLNVESTVVVEDNIIDAYFATNRGPKSIDAVAAVRANGQINNQATVGTNRITKKVFEENVVTISNKEELLSFAANYKDYNKKTVVLTNDIDLKGVNWTPVGRPQGVVPGPYTGTFDGSNYTITNLNIEETNANVAEGIAFFGWIDGATIKNINFDVVTVKGHHDVAVVAGYVVKGTIENISIKNANLEASYSNINRAGDIAGFIAAYVHNTTSIDNVSVNNSNIKAVRDAGIFVGCNTTGTVTFGSTSHGVDNVKVEYIGDDKAARESDTENYGSNGQNISNELIGRTN